MEMEDVIALLVVVIQMELLFARVLVVMSIIKITVLLYLLQQQELVLLVRQVTTKLKTIVMNEGLSTGGTSTTGVGSTAGNEKFYGGR